MRQIHACLLELKVGTKHDLNKMELLYGCVYNATKLNAYV